MITSLALTAALWPANLVDTCNPDDTIIMMGVARNTAGKFLYCEMVSQPSQNRLRIEYKRNNEVFALKELRYNDNPLMPDVMQHDYRSGEIREAKRVGNELILTYQQNQYKKKNNAAIPTEKVDVVDAGFDHFIRKNWGKLVSGNNVPIHFASIAHLDALSLRIHPQPLTSCSSRLSAGFCFQVEINNAFLRMLLGNLKLTYDTEQRLQRFDGVVNVNDDKEKTQTAVINYYYKSDYETKHTP